MHGADRIGGLASANALVFGRRAGVAAAKFARRFVGECAGGGANARSETSGFASVDTLASGCGLDVGSCRDSDAEGTATKSLSLIHIFTLALQFGFKRGIFSNESGMGSAPLVASSATTKNPARQALVSMTGTFWDTVVVCLLTGLMLMTTLLANPELSTAIANGTISSGAGLATAAFEKIPVFGPLVLLVGLITFTYSTPLSPLLYFWEQTMYTR